MVCAGAYPVLILHKTFDVQVQHKLNSYAISAVGMGTWRLRPWSSFLIQNTVAHVEGAWRHFVDDLGLYGLKRVIPFASPRVLINEALSFVSPSCPGQCRDPSLGAM